MGRLGSEPAEGEADGRDALQAIAYQDEEEAGLLESKRERKFLLKLDACLMTWAWLAYLIKVSWMWVSVYSLSRLGRKAAARLMTCSKLTRQTTRPHTPRA